MSLSSRWAGRSHRALSASTTDVQRLALALGPVRSVIRVIDDHQPPMAVDWAKVGKDEKGRSLSMSFTDFAGARIAINPIPVMEFGKVNPGKAIDICTGFACHEASHGMHSRDRYQDLLDREDVLGPTTHDDPSDIYNKTTGRKTREKPAFRPMRVAAYLWNVVEDVRVEDLTSADWPGFAPYFDAVLDWIWHDLKERGLPTEYGTAVADKLKVMFLSCRYPNVELPGVDPAETTWWKGWQADYLAGRATVRETIKRALDHLGEDPETKSEMAKMGEEERREESRGERIRAQLDRLIREGIVGTYEVCVGHEGDMRPLTTAESAAVDQLIREGLLVVETPLVADGANCAEVRVTKPEETPASRRAYIGKPDATVEALRAALVFRQSLPRYDIKLQKSGEIDDEELYRWALDDYRLFTERVIEGRPDTAIGLLVDLSGSMAYGTKLPTAQRLAQLMLWALHDQDGIETRVWGHTGDNGGPGSDVFRLWEPGDPLARLGLIDDLPHANNYDSWALNFCVSRMDEMAQPQKVLIVLSDGLPAGSDYGGAPARDHVRQVAESARRRGIEVIQVAIDQNLHLADQVAMYGAENVIPYISDAALPRQLTKVLARWT